MIRIENLEKSYNVQTLIFDRLNFTVESGEWISIVGPSGAGKTSLIKCIAGIDVPTQGDVEILQQNIVSMPEDERRKFRRQNIGLVFQDFQLLPYYSVIDNVMLPAIHDEKKKVLRKRAVLLLEKVGIGEKLHGRLPEHLSGGEKQRVAIARALIANPVLLICDEPTGSLDIANRERLMDLLKNLHDEGMTLLIVTHDPAVADFGDATYALEEGQLVVKERLMA